MDFRSPEVVSAMTEGMFRVVKRFFHLRCSSSLRIQAQA
jgi:hypothetical protein